MCIMKAWTNFESRLKKILNLTINVELEIQFQPQICSLNLIDNRIPSYLGHRLDCTLNFKVPDFGAMKTRRMKAPRIKILRITK